MSYRNQTWTRIYIFSSSFFLFENILVIIIFTFLPQKLTSRWEIKKNVFVGFLWGQNATIENIFCLLVQIYKMLGQMVIMPGRVSGIFGSLIFKFLLFVGSLIFKFLLFVGYWKKASFRTTRTNKFINSENEHFF